MAPNTPQIRCFGQVLKTVILTDLSLFWTLFGGPFLGPFGAVSGSSPTGAGPMWLGVI
jgi:hypothetical protein